MTRMNQFEQGKQTLVCGVLESVILTNPADKVLEMTMGNSKTVHKLTCGQLRKVRHTEWTNNRGQRVWIIPVAEFELKEPEKVVKQKELL